MTDSIESFVAKLQQEGVQAGKAAAAKLQAEAAEQAKEIVQQASQEAEKIVAKARQEADKLLSRSRTELGLAARDTILRLREALGRALEAVLAYGAEQKLEDPQFIGKLLHELATTYAKADIEQDSRIMINVREEMRNKLVDWALAELAHKAEQAGAHLDLKGNLKEAGFEYSVSDAKVEVTLGSVVQTLKEMISPKLREVVDAAVAETKRTEQGQAEPQGATR